MVAVATGGVKRKECNYERLIVLSHCYMHACYRHAHMLRIRGHDSIADNSNFHRAIV